jgi:cyclopropane-fatty-acyl-phospholipid synthase
LERRSSQGLAAELRSGILTLLQANTRSGSRSNIHQHYDLGGDFYSLWLDKQLVYTCAYFAEPHLSLEDAQVRKMDHICRKVNLALGDAVIEAGCGWGALALHMARRYGARVRAFNISREQILYARARARSEGLDGQVEFIEDDYRNVRGRCNVFVSVGMLEHVGPAHFPELVAVIDRCLDDEGRALLHFIGRNRRLPLNTWIRRRVFPGAYPPTLREVLSALEPRNFSVLDVENLRLHYALTLEHWLERYERAADWVGARFGPVFERAWRLYLTGSAASFHAGALQLFQVSFARGTSNRIPWTRADTYGALDEIEKESRWTPAMS